MPFDALFLSAITEELTSAVGMRIDRVQQPTRDSLLLSLRGPGIQKKLYISGSPNGPRIHFTELNYENPSQPPMFCMLLRKHLTGARILAIRQEPMERLLTLNLESPDELGDLSEKDLILELMGRSANIILTDREKRIIDCLRRVDLSMSEQRQLLPGLYYRLPPKQEKNDPFEMNEAAFGNLIKTDSPQLLDKLLLSRLKGVSPLLCRELSFRLTGNTEADAGELQSRNEEAGTVIRSFFLEAPIPVLLSENGIPKDYCCRKICQYGNFREAEIYPCFSALLDAFYGKREQAERRRQRSQQLTSLVSTRKDRLARKLTLQKKELLSSLDRDILRQNGDLIMANLGKIRKGDTLLRAVDLYDPEGRERSIALLPNLSPQKNAGKYYKEYSKAKNAEAVLKEQIALGEKELQYLSSVLEELSRAENDRDISEIKAELTEQGYIRESDKRRQMKQPANKPLSFLSRNGYVIYVGKNNRQNDRLTLKDASKADLWFHAQKIHGSHVILVCGNESPEDEDLTEAAELAAYYSQARGGQNIPVDCTKVKNVKKPAGALPGMVIYDKYKTLYVSPEAENLPKAKGADKG